jgi:hypothetical protein
MSDEDAIRQEENCTDGNTRLILYRLNQIDQRLDKIHETHREIFKRINALERWKIAVVAGAALLAIQARAAWEWIIRK